MGLNSSSVLSGATLSASGGSAITFKSLGNTLTQNTLYVSDDSDIRTRRELQCSTRSAVPRDGTPNGYSQSRSNITLKVPLVLDNGNVTVNTVRIEISTDVETTEAEKLELRTIAGQLLFDADYLEFWNNQALV